MDFHHVGVATRSLEQTAQLYNELGYQGSAVIIDPIQKVRLLFLNRLNSPLVELVEPVEATSPVTNILKKNGVIPYHFCYAVENLEMKISELKQSRYFVIVKPVEAIAFDNRKIAFLYHNHMGLIELIEKAEHGRY